LTVGLHVVTPGMQMGSPLIAAHSLGSMHVSRVIGVGVFVFAQQTCVFGNGQSSLPRQQPASVLQVAAGLHVAATPPL